MTSTLIVAILKVMFNNDYDNVYISVAIVYETVSFARPVELFT